jgi:large subunit ribosomal protein L25
MTLEISLDARNAQGKANKRLRREGFVPGVVFGNGEDSTPVQLGAKQLESLYRSAGRTSVVNLTVPGMSGTKSAIIKGVQRHPLTGNALHVDFLVINLRNEMEVDVPLTFTGEAPAVEATGGTLLHNLSSIHVKALPSDIPREVEVNVSTLVSLDVAIHVRDLSLNRDAVTILTDGDTIVATVVPPRVEEEPEPVISEEELAELEAAAEGEGAEGAGEPGATAEGAGTEGSAERETSGEG